MTTYHICDEISEKLGGVVPSWLAVVCNAEGVPLPTRFQERFTTDAESYRDALDAYTAHLQARGEGLCNPTVIANYTIYTEEVAECSA